MREDGRCQTGRTVFPQRVHFPPGGTYLVSQPNTSLCQNSLFLGLSTQWPSSGKLMNFDGTFSRCNVVNSSCPWLTGQRKSRSFWMTSIGVLKLAAFLCGENFSYDERSLPHGGP